MLIWYIDISMHAVPAVVLLLDLLLLSPPWTITVVPALGLSGVIAMFYWFWIEHCYQHNGWSVVILFHSLLAEKGADPLLILK